MIKIERELYYNDGTAVCNGDIATVYVDSYLKNDSSLGKFPILTTIKIPTILETTRGPYPIFWYQDAHARALTNNNGCKLEDILTFIHKGPATTKEIGDNLKEVKGQARISKLWANLEEEEEEEEEE
ncbi:MAG: hypothetical protein HUJ68_04125 [Clostridia bacterium]|nr:hypothetical protein [Clostridia bacterium]